MPWTSRCTGRRCGQLGLAAGAGRAALQLARLPSRGSAPAHRTRLLCFSTCPIPFTTPLPPSPRQVKHLLYEHGANVAALKAEAEAGLRAQVGAPAERTLRLA